MTFALSSPAFADGEPIPPRHTVDGDDVSPPLAWSGVPQGTASLALLVEDPDAPDPAAPRRRWVHWAVCNIPADATALAEGAGNGHLPAGTIEGLNDWKTVGWRGPSPPVGRHRYVFTLHALDVVLARFRSFTKAQLEQAMHRHVLATAELTGTYERRRSPGN